MAGHHQGSAALERLFAIDGLLWPEGTAYAGNEFWWTGDTAVVHWYARNKTWKGEFCANSGMTCMHIDNGLITEVRIYTDTEYLLETLKGWQGILPASLMQELPATAPGGDLKYPDPFTDHEWGYDTATRDGRDHYPPHMAAFRDRWLAANNIKGRTMEGNIDMTTLASPLSGLFDNGIAQITFQGRSCPLGGRYSAAAGEVPFWHKVLREIWPNPSRMDKTLFWFNESGVVYEWFAHNVTFKGQKTRNSGLTHIKVRNNEIFEYTEYTDTEFFAEVHSGWRESFGPIAASFANAEPPGEPVYPQPWKHF